MLKNCESTHDYNNKCEEILAIQNVMHMILESDELIANEQQTYFLLGMNVLFINAIEDCQKASGMLATAEDDAWIAQGKHLAILPKVKDAKLAEFKEALEHKLLRSLDDYPGKF